MNTRVCLNSSTVARKMNSGIGSPGQILHHFLSSDPIITVTAFPNLRFKVCFSTKVHTSHTNIQLVPTHVTCRSQPPLPALASVLPINFLSGSNAQEHFLCCPSSLQQRALTSGTLSHG